MKPLIYSLAIVTGVAAAGTPAFAQQSGNLRVEFQGPGGHSSGAYGRVSALHAAARAVMLIQQALPAGSYQITNLTGGNSVNSIASDGLIELKLTAGNDAAYKALVAGVTKAAADGAAAENAARSTRLGRIDAGQKVLVLGASGGVGTYAVQLATAFGAEVAGVCSAAKADLAKMLKAKRLQTLIAERFTLDRIVEAHEAVESGRLIGNAVVEVR